MSVHEKQNLRKHGPGPFRVAVLHGGPGAPGDMAPVAHELASEAGVLEPLQTRDSITGQIEELREVVEQYGDPPICLVGWSWGAWLGYLFAARYPQLVEKLILVSSGPYTEEYVPAIAETRLSRLSEDEKAEVETIQAALSDSDHPDRDALLARFGELFERTDAFDPIPVDESDSTGVDFHIFEHVWSEAAALRESGELFAAGHEIHCEVVALHGDYDPHPAQGVRGPLQGVLKHFTFVLIERCGHKPWAERQARDTFFHILRAQIQ